MANPVLDGITTREATLEDKTAVLTINDNVADGRDYLPALYDGYITSSNSHMFVLLYEGNIAAFAGAIIVDDGLTAVGRGARVRPDLVGHRLARYLMNHCVQWSKPKGVIRTASTKLLRRHDSRQHEGFDEVLSKIILPYTASIDQLQQLIQPASMPKLEVVTDTILATYFASERISCYLFPHERILVNSIPYRLLSSNIPLIMKNSSITEIYSDVEVGDNGCTGLLSVGTVYPVKQPVFAYNIEMYGDDINSLEPHIFRHLKRMTQRTYGKISIHVVVDENMSHTTVDKVMMQCGVTKGSARLSTNAEEETLRRVLSEMNYQPKSLY